MPFFEGFLPLSKMFSRSVRVVACIRTLFLFMAESIPLRGDAPLRPHPLGHNARLQASFFFGYSSMFLSPVTSPSVKWGKCLKAKHRREADSVAKTSPLHLEATVKVGQKRLRHTAPGVSTLPCRCNTTQQKCAETLRSPAQGQSRGANP